MPKQTQPSKLRGSAYVNGGVIAVLLAVFALHLVTEPRTAPPAIAEIAPQAVAQIKQAPPQQATKQGTNPAKGTSGGAGGGSGNGIGPGPGASALPPPSLALRQCFGNPPRQTEDPQSPPCVPYWAGKSNGGATSPGVTANTITVVAPYEADPVLVAYFNYRYEFYGRKLVVIQNTHGDCTAGPTRADADADVKTYQPFAATEYFGCYGLPYYYEMAEKKVISVASYAPVMTNKNMRQYSPYIWQYGMDTDDQMRNIGDWVCSRLAGRLASHAGTNDVTDMSQQKRKIAIVNQEIDGFDALYFLDPTPMTKQMQASCGLDVPVYKENTTATGADQDLVTKLKGAGVTTVICACTYTMRSLMQSSEEQRYFPEWVVSSIGLMDTNYYLTAANPFGSDAYPPEEMMHTFGLTFQPRQVDEKNSFLALAEDQTTGGGYGTGGKYASSVEGGMFADYRALLVLAAGIQGAGPHLTPETFAHALHTMKFPNPDNPQQTGKVGFGDNFSMTTDGAEWYWSTTSNPPFQDQNYGGSICYVDHGVRHTLGSWPKGPLSFPATCDSGGPGSPPGSPVSPGTTAEGWANSSQGGGGDAQGGGNANAASPFTFPASGFLSMPAAEPVRRNNW